jgi:hypothetical protein
LSGPLGSKRYDYILREMFGFILLQDLSYKRCTNLQLNIYYMRPHVSSIDSMVYLQKKYTRKWHQTRTSHYLILIFITLLMESGLCLLRLRLFWHKMFLLKNIFSKFIFRKMISTESNISAFDSYGKLATTNDNGRLLTVVGNGRQLSTTA